MCYNLYMEPISIEPESISEQSSLTTEISWIKEAKVFLTRHFTAERHGKFYVGRINTVMLLVLSEWTTAEMVWKGDYTCSRSTWMTSWKHEPSVQDALTFVRQLASEYYIEQKATAVDKAVTLMAEALPNAVVTLKSLLNSYDDNVRHRAARDLINLGRQVGLFKTAGQPKESSVPEALQGLNIQQLVVVNNHFKDNDAPPMDFGGFVIEGDTSDDT